ncbi:MAG: SdrD B-like domain-containing protein, partial [Chloroflexota bacterium]
VQGGRSAALIQFNLADRLPAGAQIAAAELLMYVEIPAFVVARNLDVAAYRVRRAWDEAQASWDYVDTAQRVRWATAGCSGVPTDRLGEADSTITLQHRAVFRGWDVTESVRYWQAHPAENFGWLLVGVSASTGTYALASSEAGTLEQRPLLRIDYTVAGATTTTATAAPGATSTPTVTQPASGRRIRAQVFLDGNQNGVADPGEPGLAGVPVQLLSDGGSLLASQSTDAAGACLFGGLTESWYRVRVISPSGYTATTGSEVRIRLATDENPLSFGLYGAGPVPSSTATRTPGAAATATPTRTPSGTRSIQAYAYVDANGNGLRDGGEVGLASVTVELLDYDTRQVLQREVTDASGVYRFTGLGGNWYRVRHADVAGYRSTSGAHVRVRLVAGESPVGFGLAAR